MDLKGKKLKNLIEQEVENLAVFSASSFFIGEINNKPVLVSIMTRTEAIEIHDYEGIESIPQELICIDDKDNR